MHIGSCYKSMEHKASSEADSYTDSPEIIFLLLHSGSSRPF